jgi:hypothetical protein
MSWHYARGDDYAYRTCDLCGKRDRDRRRDGEEISASAIGWTYRGPVSVRLHACPDCRCRRDKCFLDLDGWHKDDDET